jgi:hypothetical protein
MATPITIGGGITIEGGIIIGEQGAGPTPGGTGSITYDQMPGPVVPGVALQDFTATVNDPIGFTINDGANTGVAVQALSVENQAFFATYGTGVRTVTWGPGSSYASSTVDLVLNNPSGSPQLVFVIDYGLPYPATFNYPFTFL